MEYMYHNVLNKEFLNQINNIYSLFDLMALCIVFLFKNINNIEDDLVDIIKEDNGEVESKVCIPLDIYEENRKSDIEEECITRLKKELYETLSGDVDLCKACVFIIIWLDNNMEPYYDSDNIYTYSSLNKQFIDEIRIFPKIKENWIDNLSKNYEDKEKNKNEEDEEKYELFRKPSMKNYPFIEQLICKYIIFDKGMNDKYDLQIVHLGKENIFVKNLNKKSAEKRALSFAVFPLLYADFEEYFKVNKYEVYDGYSKHIRCFEISEIESSKEESSKEENSKEKSSKEENSKEKSLKEENSKEKSLMTYYEKIFESCKNKDIDFIIFPEMMMTENIFEEFRYYSNVRSMKFWGSIWKDKKNMCNVTGLTENILCTYNKKASYEYKDKESGKTYIERIKIERPERYVVIDIESVARIGICICRDLTFENVRQVYKHIETNILIVPAFSSSMDLCAFAQEMAKLDRCIVLVANSCSALYKSDVSNKFCKEVGFIVLPAKCGSKREAYKEVYGNEECFSNCSICCKGKLFTIDFSQGMDKHGVKTIKTDNISL